MGYHSDVTIIAGIVAYEMLKKAWEADGIIPVTEKKFGNEITIVKFERLYNFSSQNEIYYVLRGLEYMESNKNAYAFKAIAIHENNTMDVYENKIGSKLFKDFDVELKVVIPEKFTEKEKTLEKTAKDDESVSDKETFILNVKGILEQTIALLEGNLKTDMEHAIMTDAVSALNTFDEPYVVPYVVGDLFKSVYKWAEPFVEEGTINDYEILRNDISAIWNESL